MLLFLMIAVLAAAGLDPLQNAVTIHIVWALGLVWAGTSTPTTRPGTRQS